MACLHDIYGSANFPALTLAVHVPLTERACTVMDNVHQEAVSEEHFQGQRFWILPLCP